MVILGSLQFRDTSYAVYVEGKEEKRYVHVLMTCVYN